MHLLRNIYTVWGLAVIKMSAPLYPPAKLCYVLIALHEVRCSATAQKLNILPALQCKINTLSFDILVGWLLANQ